MEIETDKYKALLKEMKRLEEMEGRLKLAIKTHEVYLDGMEAWGAGDPYKGVVITKKVALNFTLDILRDIKGDSEDGNTV